MEGLGKCMCFGQILSRPCVKSLGKWTCLGQLLSRLCVQGLGKCMCFCQVVSTSYVDPHGKATHLGQILLRPCVKSLGKCTCFGKILTHDEHLNIPTTSTSINTNSIWTLMKRREHELHLDPDEEERTCEERRRRILNKKTTVLPKTVEPLKRCSLPPSIGRGHALAFNTLIPAFFFLSINLFPLGQCLTIQKSLDILLQRIIRF